MRFGRSVRISVLAMTAMLGATGCTFEAHVGSGSVQPTNWQTSTNPRPSAPAPAPMPNQPPPQPQPAPANTQGPRRIARIPKPAPAGGTTTIPVPITRNNGLFGGPNE